MLVIRATRGNIESTSNALSILIARIHKILVSFDNVVFYHVKQELNEVVDQWAKVASSLSLGLCCQNRVYGLTPIP
jgi:hypothetical protein